MTSPQVLVNGSPTTNGVNVAPGSTVEIALESSAGVYAWNLSCIGTDDFNTVGNINLSVNSANNTASFTMPTPIDGYGSAVIFQSIVNNAINSNGATESSYVTTFGVYVLTSLNFRVAALNETNEGNSVYGWLTTFNRLCNVSGVGLVGPQGPVGPASAQFVAGGDLSGTDTDQIVEAIQGITISGTPVWGYALTGINSTSASWQYYRGVTFPAGGTVVNICADGTNIYVLHTDGTVSKINGSTGSIIWTSSATSYTPTNLCYGAALIYVSSNNSGSAAMSIIDASTGSITNTYNYIGKNYSNNITYSSPYIYMTISSSNDILVVNRATIIDYAIIGISPQGICSNSGTVYIACNGNGSSGNDINIYGGSSYSLGGSGSIIPNGICADVSGYVWTSNISNNSVSRLNGSTVTTYSVGGGGVPAAFLVSDGTSVWVPDTSVKMVTQLSALTGAHIKNFTMDDQGFCICLNGSTVWVGNENSTVTAMFM